MKALYIGIKDTLITLRDYKALALIIMMPLILILVLGMALGPVFNSGGLKSFEIALVDNDKGEMSRVFKEKVLDNKEVKKFVRYKEMSEEKAREDIKEGRLPAAIIIPAGFSDDFKNGKKTEMIVLKSPAEELKASIVEQLARSFIETASSAKISTDEVLKRLSFRGMESKEAMALVADIMSKLAVNTDFETKTTRRTMVSAIQYYSVAMIAMYLLFTAQLGSRSILVEREEHTLMRLLSANVSRLSIIFGKFIGILFVAIIQVSIIIIVTRYAFGVYWGNSAIGLILMAVCSSIAVSGLSVLIASVSKTSRTADSISSVLVFTMSAIGGSFMPLYVFGDTMKVVSRFSINRWVLDGFLSLMNSKGLSGIAVDLMVLTVFGLAMLLLGSTRLRFE